MVLGIKCNSYLAFEERLLSALITKYFTFQIAELKKTNIKI